MFVLLYMLFAKFFPSWRSATSRSGSPRLRPDDRGRHVEAIAQVEGEEEAAPMSTVIVGLFDGGGDGRGGQPRPPGSLPSGRERHDDLRRPRRRGRSSRTRSPSFPRSSSRGGRRAAAGLGLTWHYLLYPLVTGAEDDRLHPADADHHLRGGDAGRAARHALRAGARWGCCASRRRSSTTRGSTTGRSPSAFASTGRAGVRVTGIMKAAAARTSAPKRGSCEKDPSRRRHRPRPAGGCEKLDRNMYDNPAFRPQEEPVRPAPAASVAHPRGAHRSAPREPRGRGPGEPGEGSPSSPC